MHLYTYYCVFWDSNLSINENETKEFIIFLLMQGSYFKSDVVNRFGLSKTLMDYSDKMWNRGNKIMNFMLDRGAKVADFETALKLTNINPKDTNGEVKKIYFNFTFKNTSGSTKVTL